MIITDSTTYRDATLAELHAYADMFDIEYDATLVDSHENRGIIWDKIRLYMLDYQRLKDIEDDIFIPGRLPAIGQLQILLSYDQVADGLTNRISEDGNNISTRNTDDDLNYMILSAVGEYVINTITTFNAAMSSVSGLYWTYDNQTEIIPCTAQYFKYHQWGQPYDDTTVGAFFYPSASALWPEGWDGVGLGINTTPGSGDIIDYFRRSAPSGASYQYWRMSDILSTGWPDVTESNQSCRSALNSLIIHYTPCT